MATNRDFRLYKKERKNKSFIKVFQSADTSSLNMRAIPHDFARSFSDSELSGKMKIRAKWGSSWEIEISKNPRFYFMEKTGWEKFVRDNFLGDNEFLTFIHKGKMCFTVNIFKSDGKEMIQPPQSSAFLASSSGIKTQQKVVSPDLGSTKAETNGRGKYKRKLKFQKNKAKKTVSVQRGSAGTSSSSVAEFTMFIKKTYIFQLPLPVSVTRHHMPVERTTFKIHHPDMKKSWNVVYSRHGGARGRFSPGWARLVTEYPVVFGDICKFTFINPTELLLVVFKPKEKAH